MKSTYTHDACQTATRKNPLVTQVKMMSLATQNAYEALAHAKDLVVRWSRQLLRTHPDSFERVETLKLLQAALVAESKGRLALAVHMASDAKKRNEVSL